MKIFIHDIPERKAIDNYPDDTEFVLDDRPVKYHPETLKHIYSWDSEYDIAITKEEALKRIENNQ